MNSVLKKIERKVVHGNDEQKSSGITGALDEIRDGIANLVALEKEDSSTADRIKTLENLVLKMYDVITHYQDSDEEEKVSELVRSNEAIMHALCRIADKEPNQDALITTIIENRRSNEEMMGMVESSIVNALTASEGRQIVFNEAAQVGQWRFHVVRDDKGDMSDVIATSTIR